MDSRSEDVAGLIQAFVAIEFQQQELADQLRSRCETAVTRAVGFTLLSIMLHEQTDDNSKGVLLEGVNSNLQAIGHPTNGLDGADAQCMQGLNHAFFDQTLSTVLEIVSPEDESQVSVKISALSIAALAFNDSDAESIDKIQMFSKLTPLLPWEFDATSYGTEPDIDRSALKWDLGFTTPFGNFGVQCQGQLEGNDLVCTSSQVMDSAGVPASDFLGNGLYLSLPKPELHAAIAGCTAGMKLVNDNVTHTARKAALKGDWQIELKSAGVRPHEGSRIKLVSAGYEDGNKAEFWLNKAKLTEVPNDRGLNVVVLNESLEVHDCSSFDVHARSSASREFVTFIEKVAVGSVVLVAVKDEATENLDSAARNALTSLGATKAPDSSRRCYRSSYALVGRKGGSALAQGFNTNGRGQVQIDVFVPCSTVTVVPVEVRETLTRTISAQYSVHMIGSMQFSIVL